MIIIAATITKLWIKTNKMITHTNTKHNPEQIIIEITIITIIIAMIIYSNSIMNSLTLNNRYNCVS